MMQPNADPGSVVTVTNLTEFFRGALRGALADQRVAVEQQTEHYVVNMLTLFARAERLHGSGPGDGCSKPLAQMFSEVLEAATVAERHLALQRLGDISLFMAGLFARSFARRLVDVDYHIAMGGRAYGTLAGSLEHRRQRALAQVFAELAAKFQPLVDALGEIGDAAYVYTQRDILRLYEVWLKTGSVRARRLLRRLGIEAAPVAMRTH
jgi:hypothetical protein